MPIDDLKFNAPATKGDLAGVAIATSVALHDVAIALLSIKNPKTIDESVERINASIAQLEKAFDALTGWTSDGS